MTRSRSRKPKKLSLMGARDGHSAFPSPIKTASPDESFALAVSLGRELKAGICVLLCGPLGAGKTLFAKGMAKGFGVRNYRDVVSPTFILRQSFLSPRGAFVHVDLYRIANEAEFGDLGLEESFNEGKSLVAIEWGEKLAHPPPGALRVTLSVTGEKERDVNLAWNKP